MLKYYHTHLAVMYSTSQKYFWAVLTKPWLKLSFTFWICPLRHFDNNSSVVKSPNIFFIAVNTGSGSDVLCLNTEFRALAYPHQELTPRGQRPC